MTTTNTPPDAQNSELRSASAAEPGASTSPGARIIKRYSNRKLYDTIESRYVTLPQIAELLRKGEDVRIIDNNTKEDLTRVTLAQILYEEERKQPRALPLAALKDLIHSAQNYVREGPLGKLIQRGDGQSPEGTAPAAAAQAPAVPTPAPSPAASTAPPAAAPAPAPGGPAPSTTGESPGTPGRFAEMLEKSRGSLQEWQHQVDERVRKVMENLNPLGPLEKLQAEVRRLSQRVEELEKKLELKSSGEDGSATKLGED